MKRQATLLTRMMLTLLAVALLLPACKKKETSGSAIITTDYETPKPTGPIAMGIQHSSQEVTWVEGRHYQVTIHRAPADSLPMVVNEIGQKYVDNSIRLEVARADSTLFFSRTFTKASFANWMKGDYREKSRLEGMNFLEAGESALAFIVWMNYPEAGDDEALELRVTLDRMGNLDVKPFTDNDREDLLLRDSLNGSQQ